MSEREVCVCVYIYWTDIPMQNEVTLNDDEEHPKTLRIGLHHIKCFILKTQDLSNELFDR